jgi:hypothetical protein
LFGKGPLAVGPSPIASGVAISPDDTRIPLDDNLARLIASSLSVTKLEPLAEEAEREARVLLSS